MNLSHFYPVQNHQVGIRNKYFVYWSCLTQTFQRSTQHKTEGLPEDPYKWNWKNCTLIINFHSLPTTINRKRSSICKTFFLHIFPHRLQELMYLWLERLCSHSYPQIWMVSGAGLLSMALGSLSWKRTVAGKWNNRRQARKKNSQKPESLWLQNFKDFYYVLLYSKKPLNFFQKTTFT